MPLPHEEIAPKEGENRYAVYRDDDYVPVLERAGTERRVLGHVTAEHDRGRGPRNTFPALDISLVQDDFTDIYSEDQVTESLDKLVNLGLLTETNKVYSVTEAGWKELMN